MSKIRIITPSRLVPKGYAGITLSATRIHVNKPANVTVGLIAHELVHVDQHRRLGVLFYPAYALAWMLAGFSYSRNKFEVEARERSHEYVTRAMRLIEEWRANRT